MTTPTRFGHTPLDYIYLVVDPSTTQPRERQVPCTNCGRPTMNLRARCDAHYSDVLGDSSRFSVVSQREPVTLAYESKLNDPEYTRRLLDHVFGTVDEDVPAIDDLFEYRTLRIDINNPYFLIGFIATCGLVALFVSAVLAN